MVVSNFGEDLEETLPNEVPLRLRGADKLSDSSIFAICLIQNNINRKKRLGKLQNSGKY